MGWHSITNGLGVPSGVIKHGHARNLQFAFFSISPRISGILKLLHLFGCNQIIVKIFLVNVQ